MTVDRQTLMGEYGEEGKRVGSEFDRDRIHRLLAEDRRTIGREGQKEGIRTYLEGYVGFLRGRFYSCLENRGHPVIADVFRGLPQEQFMEQLEDRRSYIGTIVPRCLEYTARIETEKGRIKRIDDLIETSYIRGEQLTNHELLVRASELLDEEIEFFDELEEVLRERGTAGALRRAEEVKRARGRAKDKKKEIEEMFPPTRRLVRGQIRIYNKEFTPAGKERTSPEGKFQCWYEIDMLADYDGRVQSWWLTRTEIEVCKQAFIHYWWLKGGEETKDGRDMDFYSDKAQTKLSDYPSKPEETPEGVAMRNQSGTKGGKVQSRYWGSGSSRAPAPVQEGAVSKVELASEISKNLKKPVKRLTIGDLVVGMSAEPLEEVNQPEGVIQEKAMVIDPETGKVDFVDTRSYEWVWESREDDLEAARKELEEEGII